MQKCDILFFSRSLGRGPGVAIFFRERSSGEGVQLRRWENQHMLSSFDNSFQQGSCREQTLPLAFVLHSASHQSVAAPHLSSLLTRSHSVAPPSEYIGNL